MRYLTTAEMVSLTDSMTTPDHADRRALEQIAPVKAFLSQVDEAHQALLHTQMDDKAAWLASMSSTLQERDGRHDSLARGIWLTLDSHIQLAGSADEADRLRALQALLFPHGLLVVRFSYREEAGQGALLASRLTAADEDALAGIPTAYGNLRDLVREWIQVAGEIGALENERTGLPEPAVNSARARGRWIRVMNTLRLLIDTLGTEDPVVHEILERIDSVARQAARRAASRAGEAEADTDTDTGAEAEADTEAVAEAEADTEAVAEADTEAEAVQ